MAENTTSNNVGMDWDDSIEKDGQEIILLEEGDYNFTVTKFERGHFPGSQKISACNKASLTLEIKTDDGTAICFTDLILNRVMEWQISAFFRSIGQKKHGERLIMNWDKVVGSRGRAHFKTRTYTDREGNERKANELARYYDYDEKNFPKEDEWMKVPDGTDDLPFE